MIQCMEKIYWVCQKVQVFEYMEKHEWNLLVPGVWYYFIYVY